MSLVLSSPTSTPRVRLQNPRCHLIGVQPYCRPVTTAAAAAKTAMTRTRLSRPAQLAVDLGVIAGRRAVFDFGCGRGGDIQRLTSSGVAAAGWDPTHRPGGPKKPSDVVMCLYVLN